MKKQLCFYSKKGKLMILLMDKGNQLTHTKIEKETACLIQKKSLDNQKINLINILLKEVIKIINWIIIIIWKIDRMNPSKDMIIIIIIKILSPKILNKINKIIIINNNLK